VQLDENKIQISLNTMPQSLQKLSQKRSQGTPTSTHNSISSSALAPVHNQKLNFSFEAFLKSPGLRENTSLLNASMHTHSLELPYSSHTLKRLVSKTHALSTSVSGQRESVQGSKHETDTTRVSKCSSSDRASTVLKPHKKGSQARTCSSHSLSGSHSHSGSQGRPEHDSDSRLSFESTSNHSTSGSHFVSIRSEELSNNLFLNLKKLKMD